MKFSELAGKFELWMRGAKSPNTVESYTFAARQFAAYLSNASATDDVRNFTGPYVQGYAETLTAQGAKASTVNNRLSALSSLADFGMKQPRGRGYLLNEDPTKRFDWPQVQDPETHYLYPEELRALMELSLDPYMAIARDLLIETGGRATSLCTATIGDLQEIGGERVLRVIVKGRRTRERKQSLPISDRLWAFLYEAIPPARRRDPEAPLVVGARGQAIERRALYAMVKRMGKLAGITRFQLHPHAFRHTLAVLAKLGKVDSRSTSALLTHSDERTLKRYDHIVAGELHSARQAVDEARHQYVMRAPLSGAETHNVFGSGR